MCLILLESESPSVVSDFLRPHRLLQARIPSGQPFPSPGDLPNPGIEPTSLTLQADSLPGEPQGKPKNTGVGSLSFLQRIFLTWESNWGLLHCRWILDQLIYEGSTYDPFTIFFIVLGLFSVGLVLHLFPAQRSSFSICCKAGLVVLNSLNFCLSGKLLISPSNLRRVLLGRVFLVVGYSLSSL